MAATSGGRTHTTSSATSLTTPTTSTIMSSTTSSVTPASSTSVTTVNSNNLQLITSSSQLNNRPSPTPAASEQSGSSGTGSKQYPRYSDALANRLKAANEFKATHQEEKPEVIECTFSRNDPSVPYEFSQSDIGKTCRLLLKVPRQAIKNIDKQGFRRFLIYLKPGWKAQDYFVAESRILRPGLRLEPMFRVTQELWINLRWTAVEEDDEAIAETMSNFGTITTPIMKVPFAKGTSLG